MGTTGDRKEDDRRKKILKLLHIARSLPSAGAFAEKVLKIEPNYWSMIVGGDAFPPARVSLLEDDFRQNFRSFKFEGKHLHLPVEQFVELFAREPIYQKLRDATDRPTTPPAPPVHPLDRFFGFFLGYYICRDTTDRKKSGFALDVYRISQLETEDNSSAHIEQLTNSFSTQPTRGFLRVRHDTVEININFGNDKDPDTFIMAAAPKGDVVNTLLGVCVDIKSGTRLVVVRPMLFVRVQEADAPATADVFPQQNRLFPILKQVLDKFVDMNAQRFEISPQIQIDEKSEHAMMAATTLLLQEIKASRSE